ncbi:Alpha/beta hydrolase fold protein [Mesorhizobium sp. SOD10]|nr:Alpha/beta hydrolase fold protein [Mesorhizobium sp. SOD10]
MRSRIELASGTELSFLTAGEPSKPALLLLHGFPSSSRTFRHVIPSLSKVAYVIAPDMPGFGMSGALPDPSFDRLADAISELLDQLSVGPRYIYLHDFGAPVGLRIAMQAPDAVLGLIVQNANAHRSGMGQSWTATQDFWANPNPDNEAKANGHLTFEGTRDQYVAGVPGDIVALIPRESWEEDWRVMQRPGNMETQRALIADYGNYVAHFDKIADYLRLRQPRALMLWGRHDTFFDLAETLSWMQVLPRMEAHILDGPHFLLETHADRAAPLMVDFLDRH